MSNGNSDHDISPVNQLLKAMYREAFGLEYHHLGLRQTQTDSKLEDLRQSSLVADNKYWNIQAGLREGNEFLNYLAKRKSAAVQIYDATVRDCNEVRDHVLRWLNPLQSRATANRAIRAKTPQTSKTFVRDQVPCMKRGCKGWAYKDDLCEGHFIEALKAQAQK